MTCRFCGGELELEPLQLPDGQGGILLVDSEIAPPDPTRPVDWFQCKQCWEMNYQYVEPAKESHGPRR